MNRYIYFFLFICVLTIGTFLGFELVGLTFESVLSSNSSKAAAALISVVLLGVDVALPIPSSLVMISNGMLFGVWLGGLLSVLGGLISSVVGYWLGYKSKGLAARFTSGSEENRAKAFLEKYGYLAVIASRPIPVLAESVSIISGTLGLHFNKVLGSSLLGLIPISLVYAVTGAYSNSFSSTIWAFSSNLGIAALFWLVTRRGMRQ